MMFKRILKKLSITALIIAALLFTLTFVSFSPKADTLYADNKISDIVTIQCIDPWSDFSIDFNMLV